MERKIVVSRWLSILLSTASMLSISFSVESTATAQSLENMFPTDWYVRDGEGLDELRSLEGKPAQEISIAEWKGEESPLSKLKGKVVVLDFWATWCGPCMAAIPKNIEFIKKYKDKGVALIGVHDAKSGWDSVDKVISEKGIEYPVGLDAAEGDSAKAYALKFWPTYFVIDREGIVRGAGIKPNKIEEAVEMILAGSAAPSVSKLAGFPDKWFLGGEKRSKDSQSIVGKKIPKFEINDWIGSKIDTDDWEQRVRVVQFVRPELSPSVDQLAKLQSVSERFAKQGVVFVAVCDSRSEKSRMESVAEEKRIEIPIAMDQPSEKGGNSIGTTGDSLGIRFAPTTLVVDRAGVLRASGLKPDFLDSVLNQLLAESTPILDAVVDDVDRGEEGKVAPKKEAPDSKASEASPATPPSADAASPAPESKNP
jgi:thiol-disulfide isomerase/thioredoxin